MGHDTLLDLGRATLTTALLLVAPALLVGMAVGLLVSFFQTLTSLQEQTLANQTGRGDDFTAALDKFIAASPIVVAAVIEAYWLGAEGSGALSWRHHAVALLWSAFALTDFFATDITNQRLRARQFNVGDGSG